MSIQKADWGQIEWIDEKTEADSGMVMKTGIVTLYPGCHHYPHIHYDEQVIQVISGEGVSRINGAESTLRPGDICHWKQGDIHESFNQGDVPFVHLLVSSTKTSSIEPMVRFLENPVQSEAMQKMHREYWLYEALESIRTNFLDPLRYPYSIFNSSGVLSAQGKMATPFCRKKCDPLSHLGQAPCMHGGDFSVFREEKIFHCPYGMEIISVPLYQEQKFMGCIHGGYFWKSGQGEKPDDELYDTPESTEESVRLMLRQVAGVIQNYCEFRHLNHELGKSSVEAENAREYRTQLKEELAAAEYEASELRINRHFLFNSLNSMAAMALRKNETELYEYVMALSNIFRYGLRSQQEMVSLREEMDYIRNYLSLQKLRFKDKLEIEYDIAKETLDQELPFNVLQPVAENAFVHGFRDFDTKQLCIWSRYGGTSIDIYIENSGRKLSPKEKRQINENITRNYVHGLSMINHKLQLTYGKAGWLRLEEGFERTCFRVHVPVGRN